jgi:hypothetical protein
VFSVSTDVKEIRYASSWISMRLSAIAQVDSATDFLGAHIDRVVDARAGGFDAETMLRQKLVQVTPSR